MSKEDKPSPQANVGLSPIRLAYGAFWLRDAMREAQERQWRYLNPMPTPAEAEHRANEAIRAMGGDA